MNIVQLWQDLATEWNEEQKCGFCWTFGGAMTEAGINTYRIREGEECCVHLFLTNLTYTDYREYNEGGLYTDAFCEYSFVLWALVPSDIGINNLNEIPDHPIEESAWAMIHEPLLECLACDPMTYVCEALGFDVRIERWHMEMLFKQTDNNYDGWRIEGIFTKKR